MRIRIGPGFQYPRIDRAIWGSRVQLLARSANGLWYKIKYFDVDRLVVFGLVSDGAGRSAECAHRGIS